MDNIKNLSKVLKSIGYDEKNDLVEFWFNNEIECICKFDSIKPTWGQILSTQLRWQTNLGRKLAETVRHFIDVEQIKSTSNNQTDVLFERTVIDFDKLFVTVGNETKYINEWLYTISNKSTYKGWCDLRGIDLHGIRIHSAEVKNACFANSNFQNSNFCQVIIKNCSFFECDLSHSFLGIQSIDEKTTFYNSNFIDATINLLPLGSNILGFRPKIKEISYLNLLATAITGKKTKIFGGHTDFICVNVSSGANGEEQKHLSYISWYQDSILKYTEATTWQERIQNITTALTTKNWRSFLAVFITSSVFIFLFAAAYFYIGSCGFEDQPKITFMSAIYHSVVTFTTLGYGDITPNLDNDFVLFLIILEVLIGYILLGVFIFVLSNRVNERKL